MRSMIYFPIMLANLSFKALTTPRSMLNFVKVFVNCQASTPNYPFFCAKFCNVT
jgi:hypothetical protein